MLLLYALLHHFNADVIQVARRYGQISIACATLSVVLSLKPALLPCTHEVALVGVHKWIGRTSVLLAVVHGSIYFTSYVRALRHAAPAANNTAAHAASAASTNVTSEAADVAAELLRRHNGEHHKLFSLYNVFGMIAFVALSILFVSSLGPFRRRAYAVFYALHRPLAILVYVMMIWHARPAASVLVAVALTSMALQLLYRLVMSRNVTVDTVATYGRDLLLVQFSPPVQDRRMGRLGSHVRVSQPLRSPLMFFKSSHPYTLASHNQLVVRASRFALNEGSVYSMYGPFDSSTFDATQYSRIMVVAGGSGVSMLPRFARTVPRGNLLLVWVTRNAQEVAILPRLGIRSCEVFVTGDAESTAGDDTAFELQEFEIEDEDLDETDEVSGSADVDEAGNALLRGKGAIRRHRGRPDLTGVAGGFVDSETCVVACGPESLVLTVQAWARQQALDCWGETYAL